MTMTTSLDLERFGSEIELCYSFLFENQFKTFPLSPLLDEVRSGHYRMEPLSKTRSGVLHFDSLRDDPKRVCIPVAAHRDMLLFLALARFLSRALSDRFSFSPASFAHDRNRDSLIRISISSVIYVDLSRGLITVDRDVLIEIRNKKKILHPLPFGSFLCRFGCLASNRFLATIPMLGFDEAKY